MSAPAVTPRPVPSQPGRPTRPVQRTAPARAAQTRAGQPRAGSSRAGGAARAAARPAASPGSAARGGGDPRATGSPRGGATRSTAAAATVGATALALPPGLPGGATSTGGRTRMRVLERPQTGSRRVGFAVTCTAMLGVLMLGLLLLNVAISGNAFTVAELQSQRSLLRDQQQALEQELLVHGSPSALADRARGLGMVPAPQVLVLAPDGTGAPPLAPVP